MQLRVGRLSALMNPLTYAVVNLGVVAVLYVGARQVEGGVLLNGDVYALVNYMSQILVELVKLANTIVLTTKAMACAGRVKSILAVKPQMRFPAQKVSVQGERGGVLPPCGADLRRSGRGEPAGHQLFPPRKGRPSASSAAPGSGKTSVVHLIPRFYDATAGQVSLFGRAIAGLSQGPGAGHGGSGHAACPALCRHHSLQPAVGQSKALRSRSCGTALETAQAADFVRAKPLGLDEPVEQGGRSLSGGQRQRLTIARALVKKPDDPHPGRQRQRPGLSPLTRRCGRRCGRCRGT